jgi:hypothetical protein
METILIQRKISSPEVYRNAFHSLELIHKRQGIINGFYREYLNLPLISLAFVASTPFFFYGQIRGYFVKHENDIKQYLLSGALTGFVLSFLETPIGLILGQIHGNVNRRQTHAFDFHIKDCCKYIYENNGLIGFYKGILSTLIYSVTTSMFYFGDYKYIKKHLYQTHYQIFPFENKEKHLHFNILLSGELDGLCSWSICYPLDVIKSEIQIDDLRPGHQKYVSCFDCIKQIHQQQNTIKIFYRGYFPGILKAIATNAAWFFLMKKFIAC